MIYRFGPAEECQSKKLARYKATKRRYDAARRAK